MRALVVIALMLAGGGLVVTLIVPGSPHYWGTALLFIALFIATVAFLLGRRKKAGE